jgi:EKC/KEOPS complex subunit CGI121/TPRKB
MSSSSTLQLPHLPGYTIHALLFKDVKNAATLRKELIAGNADFEYAFLDATKVIMKPLSKNMCGGELTMCQIISVNHSLAAVFRAVNDAEHNRLKSRNVHSEIVFSLSPNNNVRTHRFETRA